MDPDPLSEVLNTIRVKETIASMDDRPRFRRVFGTDIDPEYSRDSEWKELMSRQKIKQRLKAARDRRKSKLKDMERKLANDGEVADGSLSLKPVKRSSNKAELLAEYNSLKGKSVNLKPNPEPQEDKVVSETNADPVLKEPKNDHSSPHDEEVENDEKGRHVTKSSSPENKSAATIVVSAIIEKRMIDLDENEHNSGCSGSDEEDEEEEEKTRYTPEVNEEQDTNRETEDEHQVSAEESEKVRDRVEEGAGNKEEETNEKRESLPKQRKKKLKKKVKVKPATKRNTVNVKSTNRKDKKDDLKGINEEIIQQNNSEQTSSCEKKNKASTHWKKSAMKVLPWSDMCSKLRQRIEEENEKQMDFLETIRILRGISRSEFYKDIESESTDSETEQPPREKSEPVSESQTPPLKESQTPPPPPIDESENEIEEKEISTEEQVQREDSFTTEVKPELPVVVIEKKEDGELKQKNPKKRIITKIDTRWPVGHKFHTKPAEQKYLSLYLKPIHRKLSKNKINIHTLPRTAKEITEYLQWREKLLEIAYLNEFSHLRKFSLLSFTMPLPGIEQGSISPHHVQSKKRSYSQSTNRSSISNDQKITFQQQSYIAFNKTNGTNHRKVTHPHRKNKVGKKTRNIDSEYVNPYLTSHECRKTKHNRCKGEEMSHKGENEKGVDYASPVEHELETLMSRMNEDSKRCRNDTGAKSQSTDSAINEPSFNSDDEENDVASSHTRNSSLKKDQKKGNQSDCIHNEHPLSRKEKRTIQSKKRERTGDNFFQTIHLQRTGRFRYIQTRKSTS